jgi:hypothetical protein
MGRIWKGLNGLFTFSAFLDIVSDTVKIKSVDSLGRHPSADEQDRFECRLPRKKASFECEIPSG